MGTVPSAANELALRVNTVGPSPLDTYAKAQSIIGQRQDQQVRALQIQQAQLSLQDQQAQTAAMKAWNGQDFNEIPTLIKQNGGSLNAVLDATQKIVARQQQNATLDEATLKNTQTRNDQYRGRVQSIIDADPDQQDSLWTAEIAKEKAAGAQLPANIPTDKYPGDDQATYIANHFALGSTL